jgi:hypothetical protein
MMSYKFARRSFFRGIGAAAGLKILLRNLEASAQGATSPPRFLMTHWPVGTVRPKFLPTGPSTNFTFSEILKPFETAGLRNDMIVLYGLDAETVGGQGGGHEGGTPMMSTGVRTPGTRAGLPETDDAFSGGPSLDQVFLKNVPALQRPGNGYVNTICDSRVDFLEYSTQCLSYSHAMRAVPGGVALGSGMEATPLLPQISPLQVYMSLFTGFMPGGGTGGQGGSVMDPALTKALKQRKSVLDFSMRELNRIKTLAPASESAKIEAHTEAIRKAEAKISAALVPGGPINTVGCVVPMMPPPTAGKPDDRKTHNDYGSTVSTVADDKTHAEVGKLHMAVIKAAFLCDIIRVATFQWSPGTNHVSFEGLFPGEPTRFYMHHPQSHKIGNAADVDGTPSAAQANNVQFLVNVQTWYNQQMANILAEWKTATDGYGGNLLAQTVIPYVTEVSQTTHFPRRNIPAMIFGGTALGMKGNQFINGTRPHNDLWMTIAQAYGLDPTTAPFNTELIVRQGKFTTASKGAIPGLWVKPT